MTTQFGKCPHCGNKKSEIIWGYPAVYYELRCLGCGDAWEFSYSLNQTSLNLAVAALMDVGERANEQAIWKWETADRWSCDLCHSQPPYMLPGAIITHNQNCAIGRLEKMVQALRGSKDLEDKEFQMKLADYMALPYTKILRRDEDGDVVATVQELRGCSTHASTEHEALDRLNEVMTLWITDALEKGHPVPVPKQCS